jgi:hypothetical protein
MKTFIPHCEINTVIKCNECKKGMYYCNLLKLIYVQRDAAVFEEVFSYACPKFINPASPPYAAVLEDPVKSPALNYNQEALRLQTKLFLTEVRQQSNIPTIRSYLKLYTTIGTKKLSTFLDVDEQTFRTQLLCYKHKARGLVWTGGSPISGEMSSYSDVDFYLDKVLYCTYQYILTCYYRIWFTSMTLRWHADTQSSSYVILTNFSIWLENL